MMELGVGCLLALLFSALLQQGHGFKPRLDHFASTRTSAWRSLYAYWSSRPLRAAQLVTLHALGSYCTLKAMAGMSVSFLQVGSLNFP
jgi:hypothetical protein